jgi:hypothetical protein
MIARICAVCRMLLGIKTAREKKLERDFELARSAQQSGTEALSNARKKVEQARANIHARADSLDEQTGEFSGIQRR